MITESARPVERFSESLMLRRLDEHSLGLRFEFVSRKAEEEEEEDIHNHPQQFETFPKLIGQVVTRNVSDLRLVMTRGKWKWKSETLWPGIEAGAPGVEVWAKLRDPEHDWTRLVRALAGMTCASLDVLQKPSNYGKMEDNNIVFASMPSETVCTENISPWLKLLPCRGRAGLGRLISAKTVVNAQYYSLALSTRRTKQGIELIQSLSIVLPLQSSVATTIGSNFDDTLANECALATESHLLMETTTTNERSHFQPTPDMHTNEFVSWELPLTGNFSDVDGLQSLSIPKSPISVRSVKWQTGWGDLRGTISTALYNDHPTQDLRVRHLEVVPSFLRPKLGTMQIFIGENQMTETEARTITRITSTLLRGPFATFEFDLLLPRNGTRVLITYSFDKAFLFFDEFPPNPNRGFDVPSALTFFNRTTRAFTKSTPGVWIRTKTGPIRKATDALLVTLPQPDFSMPYNVITLSSTGFALFFGMLVNISVRRRGDRWIPKGKTIFERIRDRTIRKCQRKNKEE